jgi:ParB-like chromosome segregation protein Spo0J
VEADFRRKKGSKREKRSAAYQARLRRNPPAREALMKAEAWAAEMEATGIIQAEIARREGYTRARVCQIMKLSGLPPALRRAIIGGDLSGGGMTIRDAIRLAERSRQ